MMIKTGFRIKNGRIINPTAVFCSGREAYYDALSKADDGTDRGILYWAEYMLKGLEQEILKIDNLLEYDFVKTKILLPSLRNAQGEKNNY